MTRSFQSRRPLFLAALAAAFLVAGILGGSTIDTALRYAWTENAGWCDFRGDAVNGVVDGAAYLAGYAWLENAGWLSLGVGPRNGATYSQTAGDTGVNLDSTGKLSGYAWGENIGWVVFNPSGSGQQVTIAPGGHFAGYAWGENVGWISMDSGHGVVLTYRPASAANWTLY